MFKNDCNQKNIRKRRIGALLPLGAVLCGTAFAAEPVPVDDQEVVMDDVKVKAARDKKINRFKAEKSSTGSKIEQDLRDIPQSISVVKKELIESQNAFNLTDALRNVSGLTIAAGEGGRTGDSITLRGFSANSDQYLDGVKDNGQYSRDTFFIEKAEVLKGASSILFGRGATGGVINQIAKKPTGNTGIKGNFTYGLYDFKRTTIDAETAYEDFAARLNVMYQDADSFRDYNYTNRWGIAPSFSLKLSPDTDLTMNLLHQQEDGVFDYGVPMWNGRPADVPVNTYYGFYDNRMMDTDANVATVALKHRFSDAFSVKNTVRYGDYERKYLTHLFSGNAATAGANAGTIARAQALRLSTQETIYNQTDFVLKKPLFGFNNTLMFGSEFGWEEYTFKNKNSTGVSRVSVFDPVLTGSVGAGLASNFSGTLNTNRLTRAQTYAGYLMDEFEINPQWKLVGGSRYDVFEAQQDDFLNSANSFNTKVTQFSPRGGVVWQPTNWQSYYFSYGKSFNPSAESLSLSARSANLPPEQNNNYEIGAKLDLFDGKLSATAALFRLEKTNARTTSATDPNLQELSGAQRTDGFELGLAGEVLPNWDLSATYAYLDAEVVSSNNSAVGSVSGQTKSYQGMRMVNVPKHSGVVWSTYHLTDNWEVGGGVYYATDRYADSVNEAVLPGYARLDAMVAYHQKHYDVQLNVFNLTDTVYYESGRTNSALPGTPVSGQLTVSFKY
ncbi:TonB-dependent receptor [Methylomonas methanica]|uniref:TonB-dependent siderophore receptor n=1 Tax=Methylomonas methanica (strain DSM 25384 / MC09) TaxID=857087 RepID=G0A6D3_METMM|nr:TonB-dependent siderophore receptor [Methylomonas methanica]AEG01761.1 TonB-dependent siderophore receptor [Methylomonas methanica MC09]